MALKLDVLANTRQVVSEMKKAGASVDDVSDALDDMARDGGKDIGRLETDFQDLARDGTRDIGKIETSFRDMARAARTSGDDAGDGLKKGFKEGEKGAQDFKDEAGSSVRETAASISSVEDALGAVQEIAANAFVGFGPVGAGAGLVTALGLGLLLENLTQQGEAAEEFKRKWAEAYQTAAEEGRNFLSENQILAEANDIAFNPDRVKEYQEAVKEAKILNLDVNDVLLARAGDEEALQTVIDETNRKYDESRQDFLSARTEEAQTLDIMKDRYTRLGDEQTKNADKAQEALERKKAYQQREREQIDETARKIRGLEQLGPFYPKVVPQVDWRSVQDLERRLANGMRVSVTAVNGGRVPV